MTLSPFSTCVLRNGLLATTLLSSVLPLSGCKLLEELRNPVEEEEEKPFLGGCSRTAVVEDGEDNDHRILVHNERGGYMYTFVDSNGSTIQPTPGAQGGMFTQEIGGANGSLYGGRFHGDLGPSGIVYAGFGMNLLEPKGLYDASQYEGVTFFARRAPDSVGKMRLKLPDKATDPDGGVCADCFNNFGKDIELTEEWKQYVVPFSEMKQEDGWGSPRPAAVDASALYAIQFQVNTPGAHFDIWIDDIAFFGCTDPKPTRAEQNEKRAAKEKA